MKKTFALAATATAVLTFNHSAQAQLYAAPPPPGSAYLRVINAKTSSGLSVDVDKKKFSDVGGYAASDYVVIPQGSHQASWSGGNLPLSLSPGKYYSLALSDKPKLIEDAPLESKTKALLRVYNFTATPGLSLKTADGKTAVVEAVPQAGSGERLVNSSRLGFGLYDGAKSLANIPEVSIDRGYAYSVLAVGTGEAVKAVWVKNTVKAAR